MFINLASNRVVLLVVDAERDVLPDEAVNVVCVRARASVCVVNHGNAEQNFPGYVIVINYCS